jgi:hypothetical protein
MTELEMANMLADYHKECDAADGLGDKGRIQLKHARKIMQALRIHDVSNRRDLLFAFFTYFRDNGEANIGMTIEEFVDGFLSTQ